MVTICLAPFAWAVWVPVTWTEIWWLFWVAVFATGGHYAMTLAFRAAPLTVTQPVTFLQLVWATLLGTLVFSSRGDLDSVAAHSAALAEHGEHWLVREIVLYWKRLLKRQI